MRDIWQKKKKKKNVRGNWMKKNENKRKMCVK